MLDVAEEPCLGVSEGDEESAEGTVDDLSSEVWGDSELPLLGMVPEEAFSSLTKCVTPVSSRITKTISANTPMIASDVLRPKRPKSERDPGTFFAMVLF